MTNAELAVLSLIAEQPRHGYEIEQVIEERALAALEQYRDNLAARLEHVQTRWESQRPLPYFVDAMFDHGVSMIRAEIKWVKRFISQLEE